MINSWKAENRASNGKKAAEVKSLKVVEVNKIIKTATESSGYGELQFEKPEIGRFVVVPFVVQDLKVERHEYDSRQCLKKTIIKALYGSNWSLVGKSVDYRAGYLCGKLMCSETAKQF